MSISNVSGAGASSPTTTATASNESANLAALVPKFSTPQLFDSQDAAADGSSTSPSSTVTLSNGQTSTVTQGSLQSLSSTPLSEAWAPQLFTQADGDKDGKLTSDEFAAQLKRVGVSADEAKQLFAKFDTSKDGSLSMDEFASGVKSLNASGNPLYSKVVNSYTQDASGNTDPGALHSFLSSGLEAANSYWSSHP